MGVSLALLGCVLNATAANQFIFGWVESVLIYDLGVPLDAKLDTGATTSSIDARQIERFRRGDERLVRFQLEARDDDRVWRLERPLLRVVRIKQHDGLYQRRPVVALDVCIGQVRRRVEFSLVDRSNFSQPVLLGRNALAGVALVDSDLSHTVAPTCDQVTEDP